MRDSRQSRFETLLSRASQLAVKTLARGGVDDARCSQRQYKDCQRR